MFKKLLALFAVGAGGYALFKRFKQVQNEEGIPTGSPLCRDSTEAE